MIVKLNKNELAIIKAIANKKTKNNIDAKTKRPWDQEGDSEEERTRNRYENDVNGYAAEFAFCKLANLFPDFETYNRSGGYDCVLFNGMTVDVKETHYETGKMLIKVERNKGVYTKDDSCDIYVLMIGKIPEFKFAGFATKEMVFSAPIVQQKYSQSYTLTQEELLPFEKLGGL